MSKSTIPRLVAVLLVTLAWSSLAFCGEIHDAAKKGDLEKVKALLKGHPDLVSSKDEEGMTPLHRAVLRRHKDMAELLLANKADVNAMDNEGMTALCDVPNARLDVSNGIDTNFSTEYFSLT